jgi:hypothetical protein
MPGPPPKPPTKRRRVEQPKSYGGAAPVFAPAADDVVRTLDIDNPHPLVVSMWETLQTSAEARFYSAADWQRVRMELWFANAALTSGKPIPGNVWAQIQHGMNAMLISPAEKRRCAIEVRPVGPDSDEVAAVSMMSRYQAKIKPV